MKLPQLLKASCSIADLTVRKFLISRLNLSLFSFHSLFLVWPSGALENKLTPSSPWQPLKYWKTAIMSPLVLLFTRLAMPSSCNHSSYVLASSPLIILVALLCTFSRVSTSFYSVVTITGCSMMMAKLNLLNIVRQVFRCLICLIFL
ncbi:hypothetical protein E2320_016629 [Naja naja]|nr:hypothetical protein E2320_016629 [Naja naja]